MTSHAAEVARTQAANQTPHTVVAACGGSVTTSREPPGDWARSTDEQRSATETTKAPTAGFTRTSEATPAKPASAAKFLRVSMATRIPALAQWITNHASFTFAEAGAASAPSPCSPTVMAYTLPDARLASALAELGYRITAGGKNGYTVTAIRAPAKPKATRGAKIPAGY